ncbi:MAG: isoprenyl transferase [Bacteroidales bacterium]|jgi:undecaprenyl diphosphate synthase|nr:isoprenyl transferase [Bacteroidales bacterium]HOL98880.1 isoprenyl transferase [Bacteroidales bacterium]HPD24721.1 isoprenyl transferase [Bacteroidales bacterium]HRT00466.1 isoprenyl transferase [Bacteroidales bacterium]HRT80940.1 isoprenyl transferase [Bacteroidales bacterium]
MNYLEQIDLNRVPLHVAVIMDGNGRWAKARSKNRLSGHNEGAKALKNVLEACGELGVKYLTVYAFSTENWNRPKEEVNGLMELLVTSINKELPQFKKHGIKVNILGQLDRLPDHVQMAVNNVIRQTQKNDKLVFNVALSYSGRWEILNAVNNLIKDVKSGKLTSKEIDDELFKQYLTTKDIPDPDLLIRTSGEIRISNFLLYQLAYSELYFTDILWPDFSKEQFYKAVYDYQKRERRFGKTSEQIS